jgi:hypothetical protein
MKTKDRAPLKTRGELGFSGGGAWVWEKAVTPLATSVVLLFNKPSYKWVILNRKDVIKT